MYMYLKVSFEKCVSENLIILDVTISDYLKIEKVYLEILYCILLNKRLQMFLACWIMFALARLIKLEIAIPTYSNVAN